MYRYLSAFSHGSDPSAHLFLNKGTKIPVLKLLPGSDELHRVMPMACVTFLTMAAEFDGRLGLKHEAELNALTTRSVALAKGQAGKARGRKK
jgi:hypothetical protein